MESASQKRIVGKRLLDILASAAPLVGEDLPGLGRPQYHNVVLSLDSGERFSLVGDHLEVCAPSERLIPVTPQTFATDPTIRFKGQLITELSVDDCGDFIVHLENGTSIQVVTDHGTLILLSDQAGLRTEEP